MDDQAIQRIAAAVTPAVMVSACGLLALGLDNQVGRMTTRIRDMLRERRTLEPENPRRDLLARQASIVGRRHAIIVAALTLTYAALLSFVLTSLLSLADGPLGVPPALPLYAFAAGVVMLAGVALLAVASLRLSRTAIILELGDL